MPDTDSALGIRYMKVSQKSGCISVDYNLTENDTESQIIPYDSNDASGLFRPHRSRGQP